MRLRGSQPLSYSLSEAEGELSPLHSAELAAADSSEGSALAAVSLGSSGEGGGEVSPGGGGGGGGGVAQFSVLFAQPDSHEPGIEDEMPGWQ